MTPSQEARRFFSELMDFVRGRKVVVTSHGNADLDAVASGLLLCELIKNVAVSCCLAIPDGPSKDARRAAAELSIELPLCSVEGQEVVVVVDAANLSQTVCGSGGCQGRTVLLDHHEPGSLAVSSSLRYVDPSSPTCVELALEVILAGGLTIPAPLATFALAAMLEETGMFERASFRTFAAAAELLRVGGSYEKAVEIVKRARTEEGVDLRVARLKAAARAKVAKVCGDIVVASTFVGSYEADAARGLVSLGADVVIVVKEGRASIRVSKRAVERGISAAELASYLASRLGGEGGGHRGAAALNVPGGPDEEKVAMRALDLAVQYVRRACGDK
ncbi:MAG: DHH family phosphoesterase [Acidilobus sp.]